MNQDSELLQAIQSGDVSAQAELYEKYSDKVYRLGLSLCKDTSEAEDLLQETFYRVFSKAKQIKGKSSLGTWMYRVAYNACQDRLREQGRQILFSTDNEGEESDTVLPQIFVEWSSPEDILLTQEGKAELIHAINQLADTLRVVYVLRDIEGQSGKQTAKILGISVAAVKVRLHRARLTLREHLASYYADQEALQESKT